MKSDSMIFVQLGIAVVFALGGVWGYFELEGSSVGIGVALGGVMGGGAILLLGSGREYILKFGRLKWDLRELPQHVLVTGATGSGKTVSSLHPILVQLSEHCPHWGGLVLGAKGNEHEFVEELSLGKTNKKKRVVTLRVPENRDAGWSPAVRYNLLSLRSIPWSTHAKLICDTSQSLTPGEEHAFFGPASQKALEHGMELLEELERPVHLRNLFRLLTDQGYLEEALDDLRDSFPVTDKKIDLVSYFERTFVDALAAEQKEGLRGTIEKTLSFLMQDQLLKVISNEEPNSFEIGDVDEGLVLCVSIPQQYAMERRFVNAYLKNLFYQHALNRLSLGTEALAKKNLLCLIADEFQELVTASRFGLSDYQIVDRVRSARVAVIAATQSTRSFIPIIGRDNTNTLLDNLRTRFIFRETNEETAKVSADFIGLKEVKEITRSTSSGRQRRGRSRSERMVDKHVVKPTALRKLRDHECVVVHASGRHQKMRIKPRLPDGTVAKWYRGGGV